MPTLRIDNDCPVGLRPADIRGWADGGTDAPYLHRIDSGRPGPHVMVSGIAHGNEPCGAIALDRLLRDGFRPAVGRLSLLFANIAAHEAFQPADANATRRVDEDMNRVWEADVLDGPRDRVELRRAREISAPRWTTWTCRSACPRCTIPRRRWRCRAATPRA